MLLSLSYLNTLDLIALDLFMIIFTQQQQQQQINY